MPFVQNGCYVIQNLFHYLNALAKLSQMRQHIFNLFILLFFTIFHSQVYSQSSDQFFLQHLDNRNGLSNSSINHLFKDSDNILWIATWDGLNRYDGTTFHVFNYSKQNDFKSIGSNVTRNITEDKQGNIWICTIEGISRYEMHSGKFHNYFYDQYQQSSISEQEYEMAVDSTGTVFCLNQKYGLTCYDPVADTFRICDLPNQSSKINNLFFDAGNHLWLLNNNGQLNEYEINDHHFKLLKNFQDKEGIQHFFQVNNQLFYSTKSNDLFVIDNQTMIPRLVISLEHDITSMIFYKDHYVLAWNTKGYSVFDKNFQPSSFLNSEVHQMQDIKITSLALGSEQILWFGTDGNGLIKIFPKTKSFGTVTTAENDNPYNKSVRAFCEENGNLWLGTKGGGIIKIKDFWNDQLTHNTKQFFSAPEQLDNNAVYSLKKGTDDLIYIGTDGKGIGVYDLKNNKFNKWTNIKGHEDYPDFGSVYAILQDTDRSVWLGTSGYGLIHLKINRYRSGILSLEFLERFTFNNKNTGPANDIIYALADGDNDHLWLGCRYGGLSLLNKKTKIFKTFKAFTYEGSLSNNDVLSVYKDNKNRIWVGTSYGLNWINNEAASGVNPVFQKLTSENGLPNNTIHAITEDSEGNIWVSTNKGLAKVNPTSLKVSDYQQIDGLQSNEFCDGAVWKDKYGKLFFGGTYGFNNFLTRDIGRTNWLPNLQVSGISMGGKNGDKNSFVVLKPDSFKPIAFTIERKDNFFELDVNAISFLNAEKCEYAYFLKGYDKTWHYPGANGKIIYSNIPPGDFILKVKWSNGEDVWTEETELLDLKVKQYSWLTTYAFAVYALIISLLGYFFYNYRKKKLEVNRQLEMEHIMRTREEELYQDRLGFFTNIAHELQTPLTLIMGSTERFIDKTIGTSKQQEKPYFLSLIHQQASRLTLLVQQLLEFRKAEAGFLNNQNSYLNISQLLNNLAEPFVSLSEQNSLSYEISILPGMIGWIDKDKLEKIIFNLLSNAFKHSEKNEKILFSANENKLTKELEIKVANTGYDLPVEQLDKLFDKFYTGSSNTAGNEKFGTGIGLAFTRQLVSLLNGSIHVSSEEGWVIFKVYIPLLCNENEKIPEENIHVTEKPSYLYQSITSYNKSFAPTSAVENNKQAIIENIREKDRKNILIVEDESEIRFLLKDILKDDYIIYEAENGEKALELMLKCVPDIIICDIMMPTMSGLELCNKVKNASATCHIPFIILSARGSVEQHIEGYEVGADAYISKPFHVAHLKVRIRKLLDNRQKLHAIFKSESVSVAIHEAELPDADKQFLNKLVTIIEERLEDPEFNVAEVLKLLFMSEMQLYRKLKTLTGMTPGEFIKHIRLKQAAHLLASTKLNVTEIFYNTGFNNQSYFFREFKKRYSCTPNEYRAKETAQD